MVIESFNSLEPNELKSAQNIKGVKFSDIIFDSLRDESQSIKKLALQTICQIFNKFDDLDIFNEDDLINNYKKLKHPLIRLSQPVLHSINKKGNEETHYQDVQSMIRAVNIIQKLNEISLKEEILDEDDI